MYSIAPDPHSLSHFASGSGDGVVKVWDLSSREEVWQARAHENIVRGTCWTLAADGGGGDGSDGAEGSNSGRKPLLLTCGADRTVKLFDPYGTAPGSAPVATWLGGAPFTSVSHHRSLPSFAAAGGSAVHIYATNRPSSQPAQTLAWPTSVDTVTAVAFNQTETSLLASCASDRAIVLYDVRTDTPVHRTVLSLASNALAWNPLEPFNLAVANEDHAAYIFDVRKMRSALNVLRDHVAAVTDVRFSPTGQDLVTAGYDRTLRLWDPRRGRSRDVYHTRRMQRVFAAAFSPDAAYVLSGSDDGNVRLWRARASERRGVKTAAERQHLEYAAALRERYAHMPEVRRIARHRHVPQPVKKAGEVNRAQREGIKRREENERRHSRKGKVPRVPERRAMVLANEE